MRNLRKTAFLFLSLTLLRPIDSYATETTLQGKVMQVKDGDSLVIAPVEGGQFFTCRLYGIDAPETSHPRFGQPGQPYGEEAMKELKELILGQTVEVTLTGKKTYRPKECIVRKDGTDVNLEMVKSGYAWADRHYLRGPYASAYLDAESEARAKKLGLWQDNNPVPPWEFRRIQKGR
ncbi:MAG: thermonuclease family protein [Thermodesulfovibrionales bacterium]|jgi:endonuclease YncB( thermonuclease family)